MPSPYAERGNPSFKRDTQAKKGHGSIMALLKHGSMKATKRGRK